MQREAVESLLRSLKWLQISSEYSDLKIFCGDQVFSAHKALICPRSEFFAKACKWGKDGQSKSEVDLGTDDPKIVKLMIDYLYRLDYDDVLPSETPPATEDSPSKEPDSPVARTVKSFESIASNETSEPAGNGPGPRIPWDHMLNAKEKKKKEKQMRIDGTWESRLTREMIDKDEAVVEELPTEEAIMELMAEATAESRLQDFVADPDTERLVVNADLYALADKYGIEDLKLLAKAKFSMAAAQYWESEAFVRAAELAFKNTPSSDLGLRSVVISTLQKHLELLYYEEVQNLLDSGNGIAWRLLKVLLSGSAASTVS